MPQRARSKRAPVRANGGCKKRSAPPRAGEARPWEPERRSEELMLTYDLKRAMAQTSAAMGAQVHGSGSTAVAAARTHGW